MTTAMTTIVIMTVADLKEAKGCHQDPTTTPELPVDGSILTLSTTSVMMAMEALEEGKACHQNSTTT